MISMSKELSFFRGDLPGSHDKYHYAIYGQLYLLFDTNQSTILPGHEKIIREKVLDFLIRAVRALGPDPDYRLKVLGMTSASGNAEYNAQLAGKRAYNSAMSAIRMFEKAQKTDPSIQGSTINPAIEVLAEKYSKQDAQLMHLKSGAQIEKEQGFFRSAVFAFKGANDVDTPQSPNLIITGPEAKRRAMLILRMNGNMPSSMAFPTPWGYLIIKRGEIWDPGHRLIVDMGSDRVTYLEGDALWSVPTRDFAREVMLDGFVKGVVSGKPLVAVSNFVMTFIQGIFVGPMIAVSSKLIVLFMWGGAHENLVRAGWNAAAPVFRGLKVINQRYPTLWKKILARVGEQVTHELEQALIETVTEPENIAFFLGRIIRGLFFGPDVADLSAVQREKALKAIQLSFGRILFVVVEVAVLVTALHLPSGLFHVTVELVRELADGIMEKFNKAGIDMPTNRAEAEQMAREFLNFPDTEAFLRSMDQPLKDIQRVLKQFERDFKSK